MATSSIETVDKALGDYYKIFGKNYFNDDGMGKFAEFMDENGNDDDILDDEIKTSPNDCGFLEFDEEFPLDPPIADQDKRNEEIFRVLKYCYEKGRAPPVKSNELDLDTLKLRPEHVTETIIQESTMKYKLQTPDIIDACAKEEDVMYFLGARDVNNDFEFLPNIVAAFSRDRAIAGFKGDNVPDIAHWCKHHPWIQKVAKNDEKLAGKIEKGINGFCNRICPMFQFNALFNINDSIEKIANYLVLTSNFIDNLVNTQKIQVPFQVDVVFAVKNVVRNSEISGFNNDDDDDEEDDDDEKEDDGGDGIEIGDFYEKIKHENLSHVTKDENEQKELKDAKSPLRTMNKQFDEFKGKLKADKPKNKNKRDPRNVHTPYDPKTYPHRKRFNIFIDRRKKKDKITFFEPPHVCDTLPKNNVPEWHFESIRKCIIPRKGFGDGTQEKETQDDDEKKDPKNTTISSQTAVGGQLLTFSFHVQSTDKIKCYMYWMAQAMRFYPKDLIQTFKFVFTEEQYKKVESNRDKFEKLAKDIKITDTKYESFYRSLNSNTDHSFF